MPDLIEGARFLAEEEDIAAIISFAGGADLSNFRV